MIGFSCRHCPKNPFRRLTATATGLAEKLSRLFKQSGSSTGGLTHASIIVDLLTATIEEEKLSSSALKKLQKAISLITQAPQEAGK